MKLKLIAQFYNLEKIMIVVGKYRQIIEETINNFLQENDFVGSKFGISILQKYVLNYHFLNKQTYLWPIYTMHSLHKNAIQ